MIDGNISMEEDTELRDLIVQTLENNGVLAKVRAELRASIFLTLGEQQESVNPRPLLNKSIKQYLTSSEGKLLFCLVREFLEYFGLDYTISVYDPETYFGKEYNYVGRKKLCEELGIDSKEPLLGEILKNTINGALNNVQKIDSNIKLDKTTEISKSLANNTFDISVPKVLQKDSISEEVSSKLECSSECNLQIPINIALDEKQNKYTIHKNETSDLHNEILQTLTNEAVTNDNLQIFQDKNNSLNKISNTKSKMSEIEIISDSEKVFAQLEINQKHNICKKERSTVEFQTTNNVESQKKINPTNNIGTTMYFDEIVIGGVKEKIAEVKENEFFLGDLPPLNDKKANINDMKELMDIAQGVSHQEEFSPSASCDISDQDFLKQQITSENSYENKQEFTKNIQSENGSQEIDEEIQNSIS